MNNQTIVNDDIIHNGAQSEIKQDFISENTLKLIKENERFKGNIVDIEEAIISKTDCDEDGDGDEKKKKKKTKSKTKIKENGEWVIGAIVEMNQMDNNEEYSVLESPLTTNDYDNYYSQWLGVNSYDELQTLIKDQTKDMSNLDAISFISEMTGRLPYNSDKAAFQQGGDLQDPDGLWSMIQEEKKAYAGEAGFGSDDEWGGICGDIHFASLMMGETAKPDAYEYFTASYVVGESQHVYMFAIDKESGQAVVVNYGSVQVVDNPNGIESVAVKNDNMQGGFNNVGTNLRIYANSNGDAKHVATLKSALGSFIYNASTMEHERIGTPIYEDFDTQEMSVTKTDDVTKIKTTEKYDKDGDLVIKTKEKSYKITQGVKLLHGTRDNGNANSTDIWSVVYFRQKAKNTNGFGNVLDPKKFGSESNLSFSGTHATIGNMNVDENVYVMQVNYNYGLYKTILRTEKVDLQANGRANINGDFLMMDGFDHYGDNGTPVFKTNSPSGDGNLETSIGLTSKMALSPKDDLKTYVSYDQSIGVKRERNLYDFKNLPNNIQLTSNAVRAGITYQRDLGNNKALAINTNYTGTQVGGLFNVSSTYKMGKHHVFINYQNNAKGINKNIKSNLLPNAGQRVTTGYGARNVNILGTSADFGANITYLPNQKEFFVGAKVKINLNTNKKKRAPSGF